MRTTIATALSVAGVLAAGAGAYAVNSTVLSAPSASPIQVSTTLAGQVANQGTDASVSGEGAGATNQNGQTTPQAQAITATTTTYQVGAAGSVVVDTSSGSIVIASIAPASGWTSEPARTQSDGSVKVHFVSSTARLEFVAKMVNGKVNVSVITDNVVGVSPLPGVAPAPRSERHDDDREEHEREEHESGDDD